MASFILKLVHTNGVFWKFVTNQTAPGFPKDSFGRNILEGKRETLKSGEGIHCPGGPLWRHQSPHMVLSKIASPLSHSRTIIKENEGAIMKKKIKNNLTGIQIIWQRACFYLNVHQWIDLMSHKSTHALIDYFNFGLPSHLKLVPNWRHSIAFLRLPSWILCQYI